MATDDPELMIMTPEDKTAKRKKEALPEDDREASAKKKLKKEFDDIVKKLRVAKDKYSATMASVHGVERSIDGDDCWRWARGYDADELKNAKNNLEDILQKSPFWSTWSLQDIVHIKKEYDAETIKCEGRRLEGVLEGLAILDKKVKNMLAQQNARTKTT